MPKYCRCCNVKTLNIVHWLDKYFIWIRTVFSVRKELKFYANLDFHPSKA
jgi:hypothetical protein